MHLHGRRRGRVAALLATAVAGLALSACSTADDKSSGSSSGDIVIGASIPLSGPLAGFGSFQKWGYQHAVDAVNADGGLEVGGRKRKVKLVLLDDKTDPNTTSNNVQQLISAKKADALLGSCTPALVNPGAIVADRARVPMVTGCDPLGAFKSVKQWTYVWDEFFDEGELSQLQFQTLEGLKLQTNKKVALLHDNGPDGQVVGGKLWPMFAKKFGYDVVLNETFPTTATNFSALVTKAKASGADVVLVDAVTPQAVSIRKQMQAQGFTPKVLDIEKGAEPQQFADALGKLADGVLVGGYWDPSFPFPGATDLRKQFESETHQTWSQHIADSEAAAEILMDAIKRAGTTDRRKVNAAIGQTDKTYVVGPIKFDPATHTAKLPLVMDQWQSKESKVVFSPNPSIKPNAKMIFPLPAH